MHEYISGIQQIGIGVKDALPAMRLYKKIFGMDTLVFNDQSQAHLMTRYTGGNVYTRQALLSMNLQGGGGFEIWQFTDRAPTEQPHIPMYSDIGIFAAKLKSPDVRAAHHNLKNCREVAELREIENDPTGAPHFYVKDHYENHFDIIGASQWFSRGKKMIGGVAGAVIGVGDMDLSLAFYKNVLGFAAPVYDVVEVTSLGKLRKALLKRGPLGKGAFGKLLGGMEIELVQALDRTPQKLFENRFWGDCGFIHLCFDVLDMDALKAHAAQLGTPFTVDSQNSFAMEHAAGRFCYMEDPDGTLIELVETHKVPIFKKLGLFLNLKKRNQEKPLPNWMIQMLALSKVK